MRRARNAIRNETNKGTQNNPSEESFVCHLTIRPYVGFLLLGYTYRLRFKNTLRRSGSVIFDAMPAREIWEGYACGHSGTHQTDHHQRQCSRVSLVHNVRYSSVGRMCQRKGRSMGLSCPILAACWCGNRKRSRPKCANFAHHPRSYPQIPYPLKCHQC